MAVSNPNDVGMFTRWLRKSPDHPVKTVQVMLLVSTFFAVALSVLAIGLAPIQDKNKEKERQINILQAAGMYTLGMDVEAAFERIEPRLVDLRTGKFSEDYDPATWDPKRADADVKLSSAERPEGAPLGVSRMPHYASIYFVRRDGKTIDTIILPIYGYGLWSVLWGFIALKTDMNEIVGLKFYDQRETAGLGGEVDNPKWLDFWVGKKLYDEQKNLRVRVSKSIAQEDAPYAIEAISGATITSRGVENMVRFWMGEQGFAKIMPLIREELAKQQP